MSIIFKATLETHYSFHLPWCDIPARKTPGIYSPALKSIFMLNECIIMCRFNSLFSVYLYSHTSKLALHAYLGLFLTHDLQCIHIYVSHSNRLSPVRTTYAFPGSYLEYIFILRYIIRTPLPPLYILTCFQIILSKTFICIKIIQIKVSLFYMCYHVFSTWFFEGIYIDIYHPIKVFCLCVNKCLFRSYFW